MKTRIMTMMLAGALLAAPVTAMADHHGEGKGHKGGHMFKKMDSNEDGVITRGEFLNHATKRFKTMDADGDGTITKDEAKAAHTKMREKRKERREERNMEE